MALTFCIKSLGCKVNQYDGEKIARDLIRLGFTPADGSGDNADVMIVNTCAVTQTAEHKDRQMLRRFKKLNPRARVVVTGCYSQIAEDALKNLPEVDFIVKSVEKEIFAEKIFNELLTENEQKQLTSLELTDDAPELFAFMPSRRHRAIIKIQEGCDRFCSFCIIPYTRPVLSSRPADDVVREVKTVAKLGFKEIVLTGVILGAYGKESGGNVSLPRLLHVLHDVDGIERIRLSSLDPRDVSDELIQTVAELPKLCTHFHISLQSGDDAVLEKMRRGYTSHDYLKICEKIYERMPDAAVTTDIISGFPGEDEKAFANTKKVMKEAGFARCHVFKYSMRPGTKAAEFGDAIPEPVKEQRVRDLIAHAAGLQKRYNGKFLGKTMSVLAEEKNKQCFMEGLTENYMRVFFEGDGVLSGEIVPVLFERCGGDVVYGKLLNKNPEYEI